MTSLLEGSSRDFFIANSLSLIFALILKLFTYIGFSIPLINGQRVLMTAVSVGVAYGVETGILLLVSGILKKSLKNEFQDNDLANVIKVLLLIIFSYTVLSNSSATQELLTRAVYSLSLISHFIIGTVSIATDKDKLRNLHWIESGFLILFLPMYLMIIGVLAAHVAALLPPSSVLLFCAFSIILLVVWYRRVK